MGRYGVAVALVFVVLVGSTGAVPVDTAEPPVRDDEPESALAADPPAADAGQNRTVTEESRVVLDGTESSDPDGDAVTYEWEQVDGPIIGSLQNASSATPEFTAPEVDRKRTLVFRLTVTDGDGNVATDVVAIVVEPRNSRPEADAGENRTVGAGASVSLDGTGSSDPDREALLYDWNQLGGPRVVLNYDSSATPEFTAPDVDRKRTLTFELTVRDGRGGVDNDTVTVTVDPGPEAVEQRQKSNGAVLDVRWTPGERTLLNVSVRNATADTPIEIDVPRRSAGNASIDEVVLTPEVGGKFTVNVTSSSRPLSGTPAYDVGQDGPIEFFRVEHSIPVSQVRNVSLTYRVSRSHLSRLGVDPSNVALYRFGNGSWIAIPTRLVETDDSAYYFRANASGFSQGSLETVRPDIEIVQASVDTSQIRVEDTVGIAATVSNTGQADGVYVVELSLDGEVVETRRPTVPAGGTVRVVFRRSFARPGEYTVAVNDVAAGSIAVEGRNDRDAAGSGPPLLGIIVVVALAVVGVWFLREYHEFER